MWWFSGRDDLKGLIQPQFLHDSMVFQALQCLWLDISAVLCVENLSLVKLKDSSLG